MKDHSHAHDTNVKKVDRLSPTRVKITIEFPGGTLASHEQSLTRRYANSARIPGFRQGKAPLSMIQQKYKDEIRKDVLSHLVEAGLTEALEKTKLNPISQPSISVTQISFESGKPFEFEAEFEVHPEIQLRSYKGIPLTNTAVEVDEKEVDEALTGLRDRLAVLEPLEAEKPEKGTFAVMEIGYRLAADPTKTEAAKPYTVEVGAGRMFAELETAIPEMKVGETRDVELVFPENYDDKALANQKAIFDCKMVELKKKVLPELNDAFANQLKEGSTLDSIRTEIRDSIRSGKDEEFEKSKRNHIVEYLISENPFEVPKSMVEKQGAMLVEWMQEDMKKRGLPATPLKPEELDEVRRRAEHMVRSSLLLREVAVKENIALDESTLDTKIQKIAEQLNRPLDDTKKWLSGKGMLDRLRDEVLTDQVFKFLSQNSKAVDAPAGKK